MAEMVGHFGANSALKNSKSPLIARHLRSDEFFSCFTPYLEQNHCNGHPTPSENVNLHGIEIKIPLRGPKTGLFAHQQTKIETGYAQEVSLVDVFLTSKVRASHTSAIKHMLKAAFHQFRSSLGQFVPFG